MDGAVIFYFSGTGNTRFCALALGVELGSRGLPTRVLSIEAPGAAAALRALGPGILPAFAYPIYGSDLPIPMRDFLRLLSLRGPSDGSAPRDAAVFCTQLAFSGDGAALADEELLPRGFRARWTAHIPMPNNVTIKGFPLPWTNNPDKLGRARSSARSRLASFASAIVEGRPYRQGRSPFSLPLGLIQRLPFRAVVEKHRNRVGVINERCTHCGLCVRLCPVGNLSLGPEGLKTSGFCVLCLRCYNFCPQLAISFYGRFPDPDGKTPYRGPEPGFDPGVLRGENVVQPPQENGFLLSEVPLDIGR